MTLAVGNEAWFAKLPLTLEPEPVVSIVPEPDTEDV